MYLFILIATLQTSIMQSQSIEELYQIKRANFRNKYLVQLCKTQLKKNRIPSACYEISSARKNQEFLSYLNEQCQNLKLENLTLPIVSKALENKSLSPNCLSFLKKQERILIYQKSDFSSPQTVDQFLQKSF